MRYRISVIIPHHHDEGSLARLLKSLDDQKVDFNFEVIVISNPSSSQAESILSSRQNTIHMQTNRVGVNNARNLGLEKASGELLLFLDSDCELRDREFLKRHNNLHSQHRNLSCIGGFYCYIGNDIRDLTYNYIQMRWLLQGQSEGLSRYLIGGNFSCKREHLADGQFDPDISYGGSETEFFLRLGRQKNLVFKLFKELEVLHNTKLGVLDFIKKAYQQGRGAMFIQKKLQIGKESPIINRDLIYHEESRYKREMDFWMALYDESYNQGYMKQKTFNVFVGLKIFLCKIFHFYRIRTSCFFGSLENLLRNLPRK